MKYSEEEEAEITAWNGNALNLLCGWVLTDKRKKMKESICVALLAHEGFICSPVGALGKDPPTLTQEVLLHFYLITR